MKSSNTVRLHDFDHVNDHKNDEQSQKCEPFESSKLEHGLWFSFSKIDLLEIHRNQVRKGRPRLPNFDG